MIIPGIWFNGPSLSFGMGIGIGLQVGFSWGWPSWGFDWSNRAVMYNHSRDHSRSTTFFNRNAFYRVRRHPRPQQRRGQVSRRGRRRSQRSLRPPPGGPAFQRQPAGGPGICCNPAGRAGCARAPSATTSTADRPGVSPSAEIPAWARRRGAEAQVRAARPGAAAPAWARPAGKLESEPFGRWRRLQHGPCGWARRRQRAQALKSDRVPRRTNINAMESSQMHQTRPNSSKFHGPVRPGSAAVAILALLLAAPAMAQQKGQRTYASAGAASDALIKAVQENDDQEMARILGPDSRQILSSGDAAEDAQNRANFIRNYQDMHRLVKEPDGATILYVGARNWPTPIPIVNHGKGWFFDTPAGRTGRSCPGGSAGMNTRPSASAWNWLRPRRNSIPATTATTPAPSRVTMASATAFSGRRLKANPGAPWGRWWQEPRSGTAATRSARRPPTAATTTAP